MAISPTILDFLNSKKAAFDTFSHPKTYTSADTATAAHVADDHIAKGVVVKDDQGYLLVVIPASQWLDTHRLRAELDRDLHLAAEEENDRLFPDCRSGAIPPLGTAYGIECVLDEDLMSLSAVYFEAGDHEHLIRVGGAVFHDLMAGVRHGHFCALE